MAIAGRVAIVPKGDWSADATYKRLDAVTHNNTLYFAKKNVPAGTVTSNTEYWSKSIAGGASAIATTEDAGVVKPDGKSMSVDESGTLSINLDGTTITLDEAKNVIKLADTLKEKIGSALQPESIVNNQTTTVAGFALDARQANPNIDGTLAKQISDLNGSKATFNFLTSNISFRDAAKSTSDADMYAVADSKIAQHINTFSNGQIVNLSTTGSVYTYIISKFNDKWWSVDVVGYNVLYFLRLAYRDGTYCVIRVLQ